MTALLNLFFIFFRIGVIGFGGGYAIMSIVMQETIKLGVSASRFADLVALELIVPGPLAINAATFAGFHYAGFAGSLAATLGISAPCFVIVMTVMFFMEKFKRSKIVEGMLTGIRPAAVGLIAAAALTIARSVIIKSGVDFKAFFIGLTTRPASVFSPGCLLIFAVSLFCLWKFKANAIVVTLLSGVAGAIIIPLIT